MRRFFFAALAALLMAPSLSSAQYLDELSTTGDATYDDPAITSRTLLTQIGDIIGILLSLLGVIFLCLIIYSGFLWMTARGDSKQVQKAKDILTESVVGLVILFASYSISEWVIIQLSV